MNAGQLARKANSRCSQAYLESRRLLDIRCVRIIVTSHFSSVPAVIRLNSWLPRCSSSAVLSQLWKHINASDCKAMFRTLASTDEV
jgi:hypothetical protein